MRAVHNKHDAGGVPYCSMTSRMRCFSRQTILRQSRQLCTGYLQNLGWRRGSRIM